MRGRGGWGVWVLVATRLFERRAAGEVGRGVARARLEKPRRNLRRGVTYCNFVYFIVMYEIEL
jgi:hypothetical protein